MPCSLQPASPNQSCLWKGHPWLGSAQASLQSPMGTDPWGPALPSSLVQRRQVSPAGTSSMCFFPVAPGRPESASQRFQGPVVRSPSPLPGEVSAAAVTDQLPAPPCPWTTQPGGISAVLNPPPATGARPLCSKTRALHCPAIRCFPESPQTLAICFLSLQPGVRIGEP